MVEVVKIVAVWIGAVNGGDLVVSSVEVVKETAEEFGHGKLRLKVPYISRRI